MSEHEELTEEELQKVKAKVTSLLNEKNYPEAAKLIVAVAISKIDPDKFARELVQKIQEYKEKQKQISIDKSPSGS